MTKITINQKDCVGCGYCCGCVPDVFEIDEINLKCKVKDDNLNEGQLEKVEKAAEDCPVKAIKLE